MINKERLIQTFIDLVMINSPSKNEKEITTFLIDKLKELGLNVLEDNAGEKIGGNSGNIIGFLPASDLDLPSILFCSHVDTVKETVGIKVKNENGWISSAGDTILGADDKAGIAVILEMLRTVSDYKLSHGGIEIVFTVAEESGLEGAKHLDYGQFKSNIGFVLDSGDGVGTYVVESPTEYNLHISVQGRSAHAGVEPEKGINAIDCAAKALANLKMGRISDSTTFNIGKIIGGETTNIVPDLVELWGEVRSLERKHLEKIILDIKQAFERSTKAFGAKLTFNSTMAYHGFNLHSNFILHEFMQLIGKDLRIATKPVARGGGSDANIFNEYGIQTTNLGLGMQDEHTFNEKIEVQELCKAANLSVAIISHLTKLKELIGKKDL